MRIKSYLVFAVLTGSFWSSPMALSAQGPVNDVEPYLAAVIGILPWVGEGPIVLELANPRVERLPQPARGRLIQALATRFEGERELLIGRLDDFIECRDHPDGLPLKPCYYKNDRVAGVITPHGAERHGNKISIALTFTFLAREGLQAYSETATVSLERDGDSWEVLEVVWSPW